MKTQTDQAVEGWCAEGYGHPEADAPLRPDVGTRTQFRKKRKSASDRYASSASPSSDWDGLNPARAMNPSAETLMEGKEKRATAIVFGPEHDAVAEMSAFEAAHEARIKGCGHLHAIGFAIGPDAGRLIEYCERTVGTRATRIQAGTDLVTGDPLGNLRSSWVFPIRGLPDAQIEQTGNADHHVELLSLDVFDPVDDVFNPVDMDSDHREGADVPTWFLDIGFNGLRFHPRPAFSPKTPAWEGLGRSLPGEFDESVRPHPSGTISTPFRGEAHGPIAVKTVDDRGNELMVVKPLSETENRA